MSVFFSHDRDTHLYCTTFMFILFYYKIPTYISCKINANTLTTRIILSSIFGTILEKVLKSQINIYELSGD